jgi:hypothetical protein
MMDELSALTAIKDQLTMIAADLLRVNEALADQTGILAEILAEVRATNNLLERPASAGLLQHELPDR